MPIFWLAVMGIYFSSSNGKSCPRSVAISLTPPPTVTGLYTVDALLDGDLVAFKSALNHLIMPSAVLALSAVASSRASRGPACWKCCARTTFARPMRRASRPRTVVVRHALRNALIPTTAATGLMIGGLLSALS